MLNFGEDVGVASCSSHILCSYYLTLGSISLVYPDSVSCQRHSTDCSIILISSYSILRHHLFTNSGMILANISLHPHTGSETPNMQGTWGLRKKGRSRESSLGAEKREPKMTAET
jgi:hypothetical protein